VNSRLLSSPVDFHATTFNAWKGIDNKTTEDTIYLCVPGLDSPPSKQSIAVYLEFVQHHINLGANHIFLASPLTWSSKHMQRLLEIFKSYVDEGMVSISSHAVDGLDFLYSTANLSWHRDVVKLFHVNLCTFLAKGTARYVGIWNNDEFFIPKGNYSSFKEVLQDAEYNLPYINGESDLFWGVSDKFNHPFCNLLLESQIVASPNSLGIRGNLWLGASYSHDVEGNNSSYIGDKFSMTRQIIPTRAIFQVGLHKSGACHLPSPWNGCNNSDFCLSVIDSRMTLSHSIHSFNQVVTDESSMRISRNKAVIYHFMIYRYYNSVQNESVKNRKNDYSTKYFERTFQELRKRNLELLVDIPYEVTVGATVDSTWDNYDEVYAKRYD